MKNDQITYDAMRKIVNGNAYIKTRFDVVCYLVGYQKNVSKADIDNILHLYLEGHITE